MGEILTDRWDQYIFYNESRWSKMYLETTLQGIIFRIGPQTFQMKM